MNEFSKSSTEESDRELGKAESRFANLPGNDQELQSRIDKALIDRFSMPDVVMPEEVVEQLENRQLEVRTSIFNRRALILVTAASLVGVALFSAWQLWTLDRSPFFQVRPLASLYNECLERGFEPAHHFKDAERLEGTFLFQHGVELDLTALPEGKRLLGISHLGGVSRNTFAALFETDTTPVIVFIDNIKNHDPEAIELPEMSELNIFSKHRGNFVLYEVSPDSAPMFLEHLVLPESL